MPEFGIRVSRSWTLAALLLAAGACGGCDRLSNRFMLKTDEIIVERRPDPAYDYLFPYYVEICAVSQIRSKAGNLGGLSGHAVMYLKGACKDASAPYPRLRRCHGVATQPDDPEHGAGVSVNRWYRNVNWVAVPGRDLFYAGNLSPGERLTQARFDETVREAIDTGVYQGVELHEVPGSTPESSLEDFVANHSLGTDLALQFSRTVFCARLPVTEAMLVESMDFLNELNHEYATGEADYDWSGLSDNCVHTLRNALAAASIWTPLSVRAIRLRRFFNLAIPANEFVNLARLGTEGAIDDYSDVYGDSVWRDALIEFGWLPTRQGALVKTLPVHAENDLYDTSLRMFVLQSPLRRGQTEAAIRLLSDERFVNLDEDLRHFSELYAGILADRDDEEFGLASLRGDRYRRVRRRYYAYVEEQRAEVEAMRARLPALREPRGRGVASP